MKTCNRLTTCILILVLTVGVTLAQDSKKAKTVAPAAASNPVVGGGTPGRLAKWTGSTNTTSNIGDSTITEDKFGKVGIGTGTPTSTLTVVGMIETTLGGFKFPDGSTQASAFSASNVVSSLNSLKGDLTLLGGNGISITPTGNALNVTIAGPLTLANSVDNGNGAITVTNVAPGGPAIFANGGNASNVIGGGSGAIMLGGTGSGTSPGGVGTVSFGGSSSGGGAGGTGGSLIGGVATAGNGGDGLFAVGALGVGTGKKGGRGIVAIPGGGAGGATAGLAGEFLGDVEISGNLAKGGGSFKIDHPLDPENRYLYHSFVESPDMKNIYDGRITTDANGDAVVEMPDYFEALNRDFCYQLTVIGTFAQAIVAEKIKGNQFRIKTNAPNVEVSWQVTGVRHDAYAQKHRIPVVEEKPESDRGFYLHPDAFNQPEEKRIFASSNPELQQRLKQLRVEAEQKRQKENR